jgi:hypothetical protein
MLANVRVRHSRNEMRVVENDGKGTESVLRKPRIARSAKQRAFLRRRDKPETLLKLQGGSILAASPAPSTAYVNSSDLICTRSRLRLLHRRGYPDVSVSPSLLARPGNY